MTEPSNNSTWLFKIAAGLLWLSLPIMALMFASVWHELPAHVATHFDLANQPNGWMSREETLVVLLAVAMIVLVPSTWILSRIANPDTLAWALVALFYVIVGALIWAEQLLIDHNLFGKPVNVAPIMLVTILSAIAIVVLALRTGRGQQLLSAPVLAKETHASLFWALVCGAPVIFMIAVAAAAPVPALRLAMGLAALIGLWAASMAAFGFQYVFSSAGVDVRTLGFRLRSIPASDIRSYAEDAWPLIGGRGIRGLGNRRAYVWCNRGVRIQTNRGEVFLGHSEPKKIIRDLDRVVQGRKAFGEA
jgi:hypothetical protein